MQFIYRYIAHGIVWNDISIILSSVSLTNYQPHMYGDPEINENEKKKEKTNQNNKKNKVSWLSREGTRYIATYLPKCILCSRVDHRV